MTDRTSMLYNNLLYFLVVIFVFSTNTPDDQPMLPPLAALAAFPLLAWGFARAASRMFSRAAAGPTAYFAAEKKLSILAVLVFLVFVYLLDLKHYLLPLTLGGRVPVLADIAGLVCFFFLLSLIWRAARPYYQHLFQQSYTPFAFIRSNVKANLPIVLPWLTLSLVFAGLQALPVPALAGLLRSPWGDLLLFVLFLVFLMLAFPPLVRFLWGCTPLPPGPVRERVVAFCRAQGFHSEILYWPLFGGQMLTAGIMGIVPGLRYLMITPALMESLSEEELDSVLAHEIGHVKHLHLVLYVILFLGFSLLAGLMAQPLPHLILANDLFYRALPHLPMTPANLLGVLGTAPILVLMLLYFRFVFGYFIRNFERQADAYVFRAMGTSWPLIRSFEKIALLSGGNRDEKNWHHFGIGERIDFLKSCERDRTQIKQHERKLRLSLALYFCCVGLLMLGLHHIDAEKISAGYETKYAEAVLLQKVRQEPENSLWLIYLGDFLQSRKMERKAIDAYEKALQLTPMHADVNNNLAWLLLTAQDKSLRNPERALTLARTALLLKERGHILDTLATAYWANGLIEEAQAAEIKALRLDPANRAYYQAQLEKFGKQRWGEQE
jgi:Zn-dependent protease with chaperone function